MTCIPDLGVVVAAGGSGSRFGGGNKLFALLGGRPVFTYALTAFAPFCAPGALVLVAAADEIETFSRLSSEFCPGLALRIVSGGATRGTSVACGLAALPSSTGYVAIHDAARPLVTPGLLLRCLEDARNWGGAIAAHPVADTLKRVAPDGLIESTVDRSSLWAVGTPQVFELVRLLRAYELTAGREFTDDAGVMEAAGMAVKLTLEETPNPKITYPRDLPLVTALLHSGVMSWGEDD